MLPDYLATFERARQRVSGASGFESWICKAGLWPDAAAPSAVVLKLLKPHWSPDPREAIVSAAGIFFSVWIDEPALAKGGLHYNLHALKLRQLTGYALESRKFATSFRDRFQLAQDRWPNVSTAFGPQTLFQGFRECPISAFGSAIFDLAHSFVPLGEVVEKLLADHKRLAS